MIFIQNLQSVLFNPKDDEIISMEARTKAHGGASPALAIPAIAPGECTGAGLLPQAPQAKGLDPPC